MVKSDCPLTNIRNAQCLLISSRYIITGKEGNEYRNGGKDALCGQATKRNDGISINCSVSFWSARCPLLEFHDRPYPSKREDK